MKLPFRRPTGMVALVVISMGHFLSVLRKVMTGFGMWALQQRGRATPLALTEFFLTAPFVLLSLIAGAIVDRASGVESVTQSAGGILAPAAAASDTKLFISIISTLDQAFWQARVSRHVHGLVSLVREFFAQVTVPLARLLVGPLSDLVCEPDMLPSGGRRRSLGGSWALGPARVWPYSFLRRGC